MRMRREGGVDSGNIMIRHLRSAFHNGPLPLPFAVPHLPDVLKLIHLSNLATPKLKVLMIPLTIRYMPAKTYLELVSEVHVLFSACLFSISLVLNHVTLSNDEDPS